MVSLPRNKKESYRLNSRAQMWQSGLIAMTLTLNFQDQIWNFLYLSQKCADCHETKSKHIDWTPRPQMWPSGLTFAMTLTFNFQGQIWNFVYLSQKWSDCHERKANISIELQASNVTNGFDLDHNLDFGFSWSNFEIAVSQNGRINWLCTKGVAVGHSLQWPWPFGDQGQVYGSTR